MNTHVLRSSAIILAAALVATTLTAVACTDDDTAVKEAAPDGGSVVAKDGSVLVDGAVPVVPDGGDAAPTDCFLNPQTHFEIINACTTATRIAKSPTLPALLADGGLPPLQ